MLWEWECLKTKKRKDADADFDIGEEENLLSDILADILDNIIKLGYLNLWYLYQPM